MIVKTSAQPTVSIVMPTYNRATLLPPVIESILNQDFDDLELVIVDDGSTDNTSAVVKEIGARDPRLHYVSLAENRGVGFARDAGLRHATGVYIGLADSDDIWLPGRLRKQIDLLEKYPEIDILFGDFLDIDHVAGTEESAFCRSRRAMRLLAVRHLKDDLLLIEGGLETAVLKTNFIATATMVLRRQVFDRVGGFNIHLRAPELEFCWRAAVWDARYAYIDRPLIERHRRADGLTYQGDQPWLNRLDAIQVMRQVCNRAERSELLPPLRATEMRTFRNLVRIYGEKRQPMKALRAFIRSLKCGVSARTTAFFLASLLGPGAVSGMLSARMRFMHRHEENS